MVKILIIRFSSLGDLVLLTGIFREIKKRFPNSEITLLTSLEYSGLFVNNPHIHHIITYDRKSGNNLKLCGLLKQLKKEKFSAVFDFHKLPRSGFIAWGLKLSRFFTVKLYGYNKRNMARYLHAVFKHKPSTFIRQCESYHRLLDEAKPGFPIDSSTELFPDVSDKNYVHSLIGSCTDGHTVVGICPGAAYDTKRWPCENYRELIDKLHADNIFTLLLGGEDDQACDEIEQTVKDRRLLLNLSGKFKALQSAYALSLCKIAVSNDSATAHLAEAMNTPVLVIFGATVKEFGYAPFLPKSDSLDTQLPCRPCSTSGKKTCKNPIKKKCLIDIYPQTVYEKVKQMLQ